MSETLRTTIIQTDLHWEDKEKNFEMFSKKLDSIKENTDLIILPEMFSTGFTMNVRPLAEEEPGATLSWMQTEAENHQAAIMGSIIVKEGGSYFNRMYFVFPNREFTIYDKRHTFTLANEHRFFSSGKKQVFIDYLGWKICPLICYDLRFPVWSRNTSNYDLLVYVASWPERRISAWDALLKARAIENMCYTIGVNRVGLDGNGHQYTGHSAVYDSLGECISEKENESEFIETHALDRRLLVSNREHLQFLNDRDEFILK
jgi:predicted amidohydrolase